ncbi:MAG: hypothetical protein A2W61_03900, partial [Deltaproteobacteria bacterium RIFCSPLOWO2_01_44_7]
TCCCAPTKREQITLPDEEDMTFEYFISPPRDPQKNNHYVILLHGWLGNAMIPYMKDMTNQAYKEGFGVIRINQRDHGGNEALTKKPFHTARHKEVSLLIDAIVKEHNVESYSLVGFSVGASTALRIASLKQDLRLKTIVAISPYAHLEKALTNIDNNSAVQRRFLYRRLIRQMKRKTKVYPNLYQFDFLEGVPKRCLETIRLLATHHYGFRSAEEYFAASDLTNFPLQNIHVPLLVIASHDDPISDIPNLKTLNWPKNAQFLFTEKGGHVGFVSRKRLPTGSFRWAQYQAVKFIQLQTLNRNKTISPS